MALKRGAKYVVAWESSGGGRTGGFPISFHRTEKAATAAAKKASRKSRTGLRACVNVYSNGVVRPGWCFRKGREV